MEELISQCEPVDILTDSDLTRVAKGVWFDIENTFNERGGFWITEDQDGLIDSISGAPCGWENYKSAFYYEDVLNEQKRLKTTHKEREEMNEIDRILKWHKDARPNPTLADASVQIGCHYEEIAEMMETLVDDSQDIEILADEYKNGEHKEYLENGLSIGDRKKLLDDLCDQIVTAIGVAHTLGFDIKKGLQRVIESNDSKRNDAGGFDFDNGKIKKGDNFKKPDLSDCV